MYLCADNRYNVQHKYNLITKTKQKTRHAILPLHTSSMSGTSDPMFAFWITAVLVQGLFVVVTKVLDRRRRSRRRSSSFEDPVLSFTPYDNRATTTTATMAGLFAAAAPPTAAFLPTPHQSSSGEDAVGFSATINTTNITTNTNTNTNNTTNNNTDDNNNTNGDTTHSEDASYTVPTMYFS